MVAFSDDEKLLASISLSGQLDIWDLQREQIIHSRGFASSDVHAVHYAHDDTFVVKIDKGRESIYVPIAR